MPSGSVRRWKMGTQAGLAWALLALLGLVGWSGCGDKLDCDAFSKKAQTCSVELYLALSGPEAAFLERLSAPDSTLPPQARAALELTWRAERKKLANELVDRLGAKCKKDKGRYKQSGALQACLSKKSCEAFAKCCADALEVERPKRKKPARAGNATPKGAR